MPMITDLPAAMLAVTKAYAPMAACLTEEADLQALDRIAAMLVAPEKVSMFFELGHARSDMLSAELRAVVADLGRYATMNSFYGLAAESRGQLMEMVLRGEALPKGAEPPAIAAAYALPEPVDDQAFDIKTAKEMLP